MAVAYCYRSGQIRVGKSVAKGCLLLAVGSEYSLRKAVQTRSRHAYSKGIYLVPGVPEADDDDAALSAARRFSQFLTGGNKRLLAALPAPIGEGA